MKRRIEIDTAVTRSTKGWHIVTSEGPTRSDISERRAQFFRGIEIKIALRPLLP